MNVARPETETPPTTGAPLWVKLSLGAVAVLVVLVVAMMLIGGGGHVPAGGH